MRRIALRHGGFLALGRRSAATLVCIASFLLFLTSCANAQTDSAGTRPYARMNREGVSYSGPGREAAYDLPGDLVTIGMILPLSGPRAAEGKELLEAARMAVEEESATPLPGGHRLVLAAGDENGAWGRASSEIVRLVMEDRAVALVTSEDGEIAHEAEQVATKIGVPVLTLASDATTTEINLPWIFRLGPSDAEEARAFAEHIYRQQGFQKVLLAVQADHDGRAGSEEFEKAARRLGAPVPERLDIRGAAAEWGALLALKSQAPEAIVVWTDAENAAKLLSMAGEGQSLPAIYLSRKASGYAAGEAEAGCASSTPGAENQAGIWVSAPRGARTCGAKQAFARRFRALTGSEPGSVAESAYDAVRIIAAAVRRAGPNRARLRDQLVSGAGFKGVSGSIAFDSAGNERGDIAVVRLQAARGAAAEF